MQARLFLGRSFHVALAGQREKRRNFWKDSCYILVFFLSLPRCLKTNYFLLSVGSSILGHRKIPYCIYVPMFISVHGALKKKKGKNGMVRYRPSYTDFLHFVIVLVLSILFYCYSTEKPNQLEVCCAGSRTESLCPKEIPVFF